MADPNVSFIRRFHCNCKRIDCHQNAEKIAKAVTFEYGESSGVLILDAHTAVDRNSLFPEPTATFTSGDVKGMLWNPTMWTPSVFHSATMNKCSQITGP